MPANSPCPDCVSLVGAGPVMELYDSLLPVWLSVPRFACIRT